MGFTVLDVTPMGQQTNRWALEELELVRSEDLGSDNLLHTRTHLGRVIQPGDLALGYDLKSAAFNPGDLPGLAKYGDLPDCIIIKKFYPSRKKNKRAWKLRHIEKVEDDSNQRLSAKQAAHEAEAEAMDYETFLQELEEDKEMRDQIELFKDPEYIAPTANDDDMDNDGEEDAPEVGLDELLDGFDSLGMQDDTQNM